MRGLFSLLFGASMMLIIERADAKGESAAKVHYMRMFWLALFGLAHYFFIWFGDILFLYASVGCIAFLFRNWEPLRLIRWALIIFALGFVLWGIQFGGLQAMQYFANMPDADPELVKQYKQIRTNPEFDFDIAPQASINIVWLFRATADRGAKVFFTNGIADTNDHRIAPCDPDTVNANWLQ